MEEVIQAADEALQQFQERMEQLKQELWSINRELGRPDLLMLARRTRELLRRTKGLLDGNVPILFANQPDGVPEELYKHIEYAQGHITKALAEEYDFETIEKRLYMATSLAEYVIDGVGEAVKSLNGAGS
jgi:hypothetical protein